jgi:hypothetical protein
MRREAAREIGCLWLPCDVLGDLVQPGLTPGFGLPTRDVKQINDVARELGIDRRAFGDYVEQYKHERGIPNDANLSYQELRELGKEFKGE